MEFNLQNWLEQKPEVQCKQGVKDCILKSWFVCRLIQILSFWNCRIGFSCNSWNKRLKEAKGQWDLFRQYFIILFPLLLRWLINNQWSWLRITRIFFYIKTVNSYFMKYSILVDSQNPFFLRNMNCIWVKKVLAVGE